MRPARDLVLCLIASLAASSCVGTTGSDLVTFDAAAAGPADAILGQPLEFTTGLGYHVVLTRAKIHVGAVYLNRARPTSGAQDTACILPGLYVAEVTQGLDVDALSPEPQPFPDKGDGTAERAIVGEVWLTHGDVNAPDDAGLILDVAGTADRGGATLPFQGQLTIGANRASPASDPAQPSQHPICKERIVSPIGIDLTPRSGGSLLLRVDPRGWFTNVDFEGLARTSTNPPLYTFADSAADAPSINLYHGIQARGGVYDFSWSESPKR
jgi:hypothetical protein